MKRTFRQIALYCLLVALSCAYGIASAAVTNRASVTFDDPLRGNVTQQSNKVRAIQPQTISYFTGSDYGTAAKIGVPGQRLYVQADASACNADPEIAETVDITIGSQKTGDDKTFVATETGPDTGVFRINTPLVTAPLDSEGAQDGDTTVHTTKNDSLVATVKDCGTGPATTAILIDPAGVVFDSSTGLPIAGARVTLIDVTGAGNGGAPGAAATVIALDGVSAAPSSVVTDADGMFQFPLVGASLYRLQVVPPKNYTFPSKVEAGKLAGNRTIQLYGSYGANFTVSAATGAVTLDVPLDPIPGTMYLEKTASRADAEVGDFVDYTIRIHNTAEIDLSGVKVIDELPAGFSLVPGTVRLDGVAVADPDGLRGPSLTFAAGTIGAKGESVLRYRVRIGAGALQGDGINRAHATSEAPAAFTSTVAAAKVKVSAGVFSEKAYIVGSIFADCDGDKLKGALEPGVPGVRVYLEDGSYAVTDADGRYSFADLRPRTHVAKVDLSTLPQGAALAILGNRNAGDAGSRFVDLHDGELGKADFAIAACTPALREAIGARRNAAQAQERAETAKAAVPAAPKSAQAAQAIDLNTLDNSLGFVGIDNGAVLPRALANVRIKGTAGSTFTLSANGKAVDAKQVGKRSTVASRQLESWEFVGVALQPGKNVLEVSQRDQFGNARGSQRIDVTAPGKLARLRLELDKASVAADGRSLAAVRLRLEDENGVPVLDRTAVTVDATRGSWEQADLDPREPGLQVFVEGGQTELALRAPKEAGEAAIKAASGTLEAATRVDFVPDLRPLVAAGLVDGALRLKSIKGNVGKPAREFNGFEDALRSLSETKNGSTLDAGARAAVFAKGQVAKDTLLTLSYDSDKVNDQPLFRDLDPTLNYPAYGDNAQRGFDAQSTGRLYLRADRNKSYLLYGDFTPPGATPARNLGAYNRSLNGLRHHYEANGLSVDAFVSRASTRQLVEEIAANGTSGPYHTASGSMVINSERIEIIVRDRNQAGLLVSRRQLSRYADYDIEPLTGRILFRAPIASLDADLNPVTIRISYEVDQGNPNFWIAGAAAQYQINKAVEIGASYVTDKNPSAETRLASVNATLRPDDKTVINLEGARMDKLDVAGRAARIDATRKDGKLESRAYFGRADADFDNPAASLPKGRAEGGARVTWRADERTSFGAEVIHTADLATGASRDGAELQAGYAFGNGIRVEGGVRRAHENAAGGTVLAQPDLTSLRAKVAAQVPGLPQAGVFVEAEQDVRDSTRRMVALGGDYRLAGGSRLYGRHELISSLGSNYDLNAGQQRNATVFGIDSDYMKDGRVFTEYRARGANSGVASLDGRQAEAALGLRNLWTVADGVRMNTSLERVKVLAGNAANESVAAAVAVDYSRDPSFRANSRLEVRHAEDSNSVLSTVGIAYKLSETWALLGKNTLAATHSKGGSLNDGSSKVTDLFQAGVAYRALATLGWNGLAKYEYKLARDTGLADLERAVHAIGITANWQPRAATLFSARYAAKVAQDRSGGLDTRSVAQLFAARVTQELKRDWDVGASLQMLVDGGTRGRQFAAGLEAGYQLRKNMWVSAGYNVLGFREPDLASADATARGVYARLRMKFDERTLEGLLSPQASH
jgi:uncharacterized repeat protein (TIGR01451 family)